MWCFVASFGAYFCMYAFRKPFNAGAYEGHELFGMSMKTVLILSQVFGYMLSKFIGVKVISELRPEKRVRLIVSLIVFAEIALLFFGLVPNETKWLMLFLNGIPLGMVWGVVFSFLEGRRLTELIATGLSVSAIVSSGSLKSMGRVLIEQYHISDFWMPSVIGVIFLPLFLLFVWMLRMIPPPSKEDVSLKSKRDAMTKQDRRQVMRKYGLGIVMLVLTYALFSIFRDFRDNFAVEIWADLGGTSSPSIYTWTELPVAVIVILTTAFLVFFKDNFNGLFFTLGIVLVGLIVIGVSTLLFMQEQLSPMSWMIVNGLGLYMAYVPFQIVVYERLVALFKIKGNAGYLMYLSDSIGYLGSVVVLIYKEFFVTNTDWLSFFEHISIVVMILGIACLLFASMFFIRKYNLKKSMKWSAY